MMIRCCRGTARPAPTRFFIIFILETAALPLPVRRGAVLQILRCAGEEEQNLTAERTSALGTCAFCLRWDRIPRIWLSLLGQLLRHLPRSRCATTGAPKCGSWRPCRARIPQLLRCPEL